MSDKLYIKLRKGEQLVINKDQLIEYKELKKVDHGTGATRHDDIGEERYDLISPHALKHLASVYGHGAKRHGDRNWEQGLPYGDTYNRALRHLQRFHAIRLGLIPDDGEDHIGHAFWGIAAIIHFIKTGYYDK